MWLYNYKQSRYFKSGLSITYLACRLDGNLDFTHHTGDKMANYQTGGEEVID